LRRAVPLRQAQKDLTRQRLVDAGLEVFLVRGYEDATVEEIADRANVGRSTFYSHFQGKADVAIAIALVETGPLNEAVAALGEVDPDNPKTISKWLLKVEQQFLAENTVVTLVMQHMEVAQEFVLIQRRCAEQALQRLEERGWRPVVDDAAEHFRLLLLLVNRWLYLHVVQHVPRAEGSREALIHILSTQIQGTVRRKV
jgi:AcrR family transcriptional regulator